MKKRHEQKLVIISIVLFFGLNFPLLLIFNRTGHLFGIPIMFLAIMFFWMGAIILSYFILKRYYE